MLDTGQLQKYIHDKWDHSIIQTLAEFIRIPNKSPSFDAEWEQHGHMKRALDLIVNWCQQNPISGMTYTVESLPGRTPLLFIELPSNMAGNTDKTVLLYGHLDKQPEMTGWAEGYGPWQPVIKDDKLYGRGAADDGYAIFAAMTALAALHQQEIPHARCVIIIEACEESGSFDLPDYLHLLGSRIGQVDLVIGLDSGCGNYDQFWVTTSLRGYVGGILSVNILEEGVHSGLASGIVPSSWRILRQLLARIEDAETGKMLLPELSVSIPENRLQEAKQVATTLGDEIWQNQPFVPGAKPQAKDNLELVLNRTWRPALAVTGIAGIPDLKDAGNVLRPNTDVMLSIRIPPTCNAQSAANAIKKALEHQPPYRAKVSFELKQAANGWNAPVTAPWLDKAMQQASHNHYQQAALYWGEGGSIPFMGMLGEKFPQAQFIITGVLGPHSNAHGPNEFLHLPMAKKLTACIAEVIAAFDGTSSLL